MKNEMNMKEYTFKENSFEFVNIGAKMSDQKFDTKPTTFVYDAFRRFCKNKSSVVAAMILGIIILMAIFVPVITGYNTDRVSVTEQFLEPKLFEAGTGFWDGTRSYAKKINTDGSPSGVIYDRENDTPAGFYRPAVMELTVDTEATYINQAIPYGSGGYVMIENQNTDGLTNIVLSSDEFTVTVTGNYKVSVTLNPEVDVLNYTPGEYSIYFLSGETRVELKDWSRDYSSFELNLSAALEKAGIEELDGNFVFELKPASLGEAAESTKGYTYLLIENCIFAADKDVSNYDDLDTVGFNDATKMVLLAKDGQGTFPRGYWSCTGRKGIYKSEVFYCSFIYDTYAAVFDAQNTIYAASDFNKLVKAGLCSYDAEIGPESFVKLSDECPIVSITSQKLNPKTGKLLEINANAYRYAKMGYDEMPKYLLGTDASGVDVFTRVFKGLRTSLILGVCTFAFCFMFGLIWGSVSGYFGGTVDLAMERFCEILSGVPWIVVITLAILHLGNNFLTFFLALCLTGWMGTAARTRSQFYRFKHSEYVLASRTLGSSDIRLIFKHILPNALGTIVTSSVLMIPSVIFSEATLAYLNLGLQGVASFGVMLSENQQYIQSYPYLIVFPSVVMALLMISFNLFGNGLRDAINPTLKGVN